MSSVLKETPSIVTEIEEDEDEEDEEDEDEDEDKDGKDSPTLVCDFCFDQELY
jgi:hypothetical protein